jgi:hypothetical protein
MPSSRTTPEHDTAAHRARPQTERTLRQHCEDLATVLGKLLVICAAIVGAAAWVGTLLGVKLSGPPSELAVIARQTDALALRVGRLEENADSVQRQMSGLSFDVQFLSYMLCVRNRGGDPMAVERCAEIIKAMKPRPVVP